MHTPRRSRSGLTLVEVVLGLALFTTFASAAFMALEASASSYRTETSAAHLDFLARKALDDVAEHLQAADYDSFVPAPVTDPGESATRVDFQCARGFSGGAIEWGPIERLDLEPDASDAPNGLDDDADGLVDEGRLVWIENPGLAGGRRTVLCSQVSASLEGELAGNGLDDNGNGLIDEGGFCLEFTGDRVRVHLTLERCDPDGRLIRQSSIRTITPRNTQED
jgi:hypothetical protein